MKFKLLSMVLALSMAVGFTAYAQELPYVAPAVEVEVEEVEEDLSYLPRELSASIQTEWDCLMFSNIRRYQNDPDTIMVVMTDVSQEAAEIRAYEVNEEFTHYRPNGDRATQVLIDMGVDMITGGENIASAIYGGEYAATRWFQSITGHKETLLATYYHQMGVGYLNGRWSQLMFKEVDDECTSITYYERLGYFELTLLNGKTAYAPYHEITSPEVDGVVTFNYPWADGYTQEIVVIEDDSDTWTHAFIDIEADVYYEDAVVWATNTGITQGTTDTTFSPNAVCTRAQAVTLMWRYWDSPEPETTDNPFTDISEDDYYYQAVLWAVENDITTGTTETTFSPGSQCSSVQILTLLWRMCGFTTEVPDDVPYYTYALNRFRAYSIYSEVHGDTVDETALATRSEIVIYLYNIMKEQL